MKQRKRMGLPTARGVSSARTNVPLLAALAGAENATTSPSIAGGTIAALMERLANARQQESAPVQRYRADIGAATLQPKVVRRRVDHA